VVGEQAIAAYYQALAPFWHPLIRTEDLRDGPQGCELLGRPLTLFRHQGELACLDDVCRHFGASLSLGKVVGGGLRCRYHGWTYNRDGRCVDIPARRGVPIPREARVRSYPVRERYGLVWASLAPEPATSIPEFPEHDDDRYHLTPIRAYGEWRATAPRIVMGALDDTHFPWVHPGLLGDPEHPEPPDHEAFRERDYLVSRYSTLQPANETISGPDLSGRLEAVTYTNWCTPTTIRLRKDGPAGTYAIYQVMCPVSAERTLVFLQMARDFDRDPARDQSYLEFEDKIQEQDRPVIESQRPWLLPPLSARLTLFVRPADLPLIAFQRWLEELGVPQV
jgi:phenylpropionate dioxygenase-like ring-hydroxylating dioxygenase large terminal subunit